MKSTFLLAFAVLAGTLVASAQTKPASSKPAKVDETEIITTEKLTSQKMPEYPGGERAMMQDLNKNIVYPEQAIANKKQGVVYVELTVDTDGSVGNVIVKRGVKDAPELDRAAIDAVKKLKRFTPASEAGKAVKQTMVLPVKFQLS